MYYYISTAYINTYNIKYSVKNRDEKERKL